MKNKKAKNNKIYRLEIKPFGKWLEFKDTFLHKYANRTWQKLYFINDHKIGIIIAEYIFRGDTRYEIDIQIPDEFTILDKTINITIFTYPKLDFIRMEKEALRVIKKLLKKRIKR